MSKYTLMFFKKDCMGCHSCEVACKQEHELGVGPRLVRVLEDSPDFKPVYCHHCANAPCREACPFGAMQFDDDQDLAVKCDLCIDRLEQGQAPACVSVCATGCIFWGDTRQLSERLAAQR